MPASLGTAARGARPADVPFLDPSRTWDLWGPKAVEDIARILASHRYVRGPQIEAFEAEFARATDAAHAVALASGTAALRLGVQAIVSRRPEAERDVIVPALSFAATAAAVVEAGARPVFADVDPRTALLTAEGLEESLTPQTAAVVAVHLYGSVCDMDSLRGALNGREIYLIEDAAQAAGARWNGRSAGSLGDAAAFSFYPSKNLAAAGDAGALTTSDPVLAERVRRLREHGRYRSDQELAEVGTNARMDEIQAAVLRRRLPHLEATNETRRRIAARYDAQLAGSVARPLGVPTSAVPARHLYTCRVSSRERLAEELGAAGIQTAVYYPRTLADEPCFARFSPRPCPNARGLAREVLSLPCFPGLTPGEQDRVTDCILSSPPERGSDSP